MTSGNKLILQFGWALALVLFMSGGLFYCGIHVTAHLMKHPAPAVYWPNDAARAAREKAKKDHPNDIFTIYNSAPDLIYSTPDGRFVEFGLRSDGVVLWRERKK